MLAIFAMLAATAAQSSAQPDEIVVSGTRWKCHIEYADHAMSDREFDRRAAEWAKGVPVRIVAPQSADYECLARIASRLGDRGVKLIEFVDPAAPADPPR